MVGAVAAGKPQGVARVGFEVVDLDWDAAESDGVAAECSCGARRTLLRHFAVSPCAGRALALLKAAHRAEYDRYLADLKAEALAEFEAAWDRHLAGDHRGLK